MEYKKQHWIPQSYLKAWIDPEVPKNYEPYVWVFSKDGREAKKKSPKSIFFEKEMYTINHSKRKRNLLIEKTLAEIESQFINIKRNKLDKKLKITKREHDLLMLFIAAIDSRTKKQRDHLVNQSIPMYEFAKNLVASHQNDHESTDRKFNKNIQSHHDDTDGLKALKDITYFPLQHLLFTMIKAQYEELVKMDAAIFYTKIEPGFISSDAPCVWCVPDAMNRPAWLRNPSFMHDTLEITLPISPEMLILLSWNGPKGYIEVKNEDLLNEFNRRTRNSCERHYIVKTNVRKKGWFII